MHASLGCSLPHTTKKTKTKTRDRNRNRADAADAVASRACTGSGQRQAERNSTQWAFVIMCKIHHTSLACMPACQPASQLLCCYVRGSTSIRWRVSSAAHVCAHLRHCHSRANIISQVNEKQETCGVFSRKRSDVELATCLRCLRVACIKLCVDVGCIF